MPFHSVQLHPDGETGLGAQREDGSWSLNWVSRAGCSAVGSHPPGPLCARHVG